MDFFNQAVDGGFACEITLAFERPFTDQQPLCVVVIQEDIIFPAKPNDIDQIVVH